METEQRKGRRSRRDELRTLINEWDPAGLLAGGSPRDAYDSLIDPLLDRLSRDVSAADLTALLSASVRENFNAGAPDPERFAGKVLAWHRLSAEEAS